MMYLFPVFTFAVGFYIGYIVACVMTVARRMDDEDEREQANHAREVPL